MLNDICEVTGCDQKEVSRKLHIKGILKDTKGIKWEKVICKVHAYLL